MSRSRRWARPSAICRETDPPSGSCDGRWLRCHVDLALRRASERPRTPSLVLAGRWGWPGSTAPRGAGGADSLFLTAYLSVVGATLGPMATFGHGSRHVWYGASPRAVRCAYMFCEARPSGADVERLRVEIEAARRTRTAIDFRARPPS